MEERRRFRRTPAKEKAFLQGKEAKRQEGLLMDVSSGGMRFLSDAKLKIGASLFGQFKIMPNLGDFYIAAEVVWVKPVTKEPDHATTYEVGIKFNKVSTIPISA